MLGSGRLWLIAALVVATGAARGGTLYTVAAGESLSTIAARTYGDGRAWSAIMLATNARLSEIAELEYIGDPNTIGPGQQVWLPDAAEKDHLMQHFRDYVAAVLDMSLPQPWEVSRSLIAIAPQDPITVVSWVQAGRYSIGRSQASGQIWVTVVPHLRDFCRALKDETELVTRLEQRLGLPPASNKTEFVEIRLPDPAAAMFRPCADPRIDTTTCPLGPPADDSPHRDWFLGQYFASYAMAHPSRYPWTSLGYTFDWGDPASEHGESEFVIRPGAKIDVVSITSTADYCR